MACVHPTQAIRKLHQLLKASREAAVERTLPKKLKSAATYNAVEEDLDEELGEAAKVRRYRRVGRGCVGGSKDKKVEEGGVITRDLCIWPFVTSASGCMVTLQCSCYRHHHVSIGAMFC